LLSGNVTLRGFIGLCGWFPQAAAITKVATKEAKKTHVFLCHSQDDDVIDVRYGRELCDTLEAMGMQVEWEEYPDGGHWVNEPLGLEDIMSFLSFVNFA
jgi:predicted esterase